jgi:hypothetical protein
MTEKEKMGLTVPALVQSSGGAEMRKWRISIQQQFSYGEGRLRWKEIQAFTVLSVDGDMQGWFGLVARPGWRIQVLEQSKGAKA